jgi:hypothetical protein
MRDELDAALAFISRDPDEPHQLDGDRCTIQVPLPPGLVEGLDAVEVTVRLSGGGASGEIVSLISPLASMTEEELSGTFATSLLRRQFFATQTDGASFAIADREDVLVAIHHWMPDRITPTAFTHVFGRFVSAAVRLHGEAMTAAAQGAPIQPFTTS